MAYDPSAVLQVEAAIYECLARSPAFKKNDLPDVLHELIDKLIAKVDGMQPNPSDEELLDDE